MDGEYKILKNENGKIIEVPFERLEREILKSRMASLNHELELIREKINGIFAEFYGEGKVGPELGLADLCRNEMLSRSTFTIRQIAEVLETKYKTLFTKGSYNSTAWKIKKELEIAGKIHEYEKEPGKFFNIALEEKEEIAEEEKTEGLDSSSMPSEEHKE